MARPLALTLCAAALCADALDVSRRKVLHTPAALAALATPPPAVATPVEDALIAVVAVALVAAIAQKLLLA